VAIPEFQSLMYPLLVLLRDGRAWDVEDVRSSLAAQFHLTEAELEERLPSGGTRVFVNRVAWALSHFVRAAVVEAPQRGAYRITERGRELLADASDAQRLDLQTLKAFAQPRDASDVSMAAGVGSGVVGRWRPLGVIDGFSHRWPEVHEHYPPMRVWRAPDDGIEFAIGKPRERLLQYGRERGWVSVWEVASGRPREQRAVFVETDDFDQTGDHAALIFGRGGATRRGFPPEERDQLPSVYREMRIQVQRDRLAKSRGRNLLAVIAREDEPRVMLEHALANLQLRTPGGRPSDD
jgi:hypothetical protein